MKTGPDAVVLGTGYVGLTLALHMASRGLSILAVDKDSSKISRLAGGETSIFETGIQGVLKQCIESARLRFSTSPPEGASAWILAVSYIPSDAEHYLQALKSIRGRDGEAPLIVIRGTVPVGYIRSVLLPALENQFQGRVEEAFHLVSCPERSLSGAALEELEEFPQLIGGPERSVEKAAELFEKVGISCIRLPSWEGGELAKGFTNFARLVQFNLSNFFGVLCHQYDLSEEVLFHSIREGYPRLNFLSVPGSGVGGFCLPKDAAVLSDGLDFLGEWAKAYGHLKSYPQFEFDLNRDVIRFHADRVLALVRRADSILALGIAFKGKPATDDVRDSVGLSIVRHLQSHGCSVQVHDRTVPRERLERLEISLAALPLDMRRYQAILLLNNDPAYRRILLEFLPPDLERSVILYDPWRLIVTGRESIFQTAFPWQAFRRHIS